jgi:DNA primase catalytic core
MSRKFRDIEQVRNDMKLAMPLNEVIELVDGKQLEYVNDELYKKCCDMDEHPIDEDGSRDSTASFTVAPLKELFYCFGCGASGDRFEYVARKLHVEHVQSIIKCAEIQGFDLGPYWAEQTPGEILRDSLFMESSQARNMAHEALLSNKKALDYLLGRGFTMDTIEEYLIGYAPPVTSEKVTFFDSVPNSISLQLDRKDQFNDAILFPVCDFSGRMRYFQSRPFNPMPGMKYIGGNDTHPLYDEVDRLFGFSVARKKLRTSNGRMYGTEGGPDAMAMNQHGFPTVGVLGTAINQHLFEILDKNRVQEFTLVLDGDVAGQNKSKSVSEKYLTIATKVRLRIATLPDGYDPNDFFNAYSNSDMQAIVDKAPYAIEYLLDIAWRQINPVTPTEKMQYMAEVQKYLITISDPFTKGIMTQYISQKLNMDPVQIDDYYKMQTTTEVGAQLYAPDEEEILLAQAMRQPDFIVELMMRFKIEDWYLTRHKYLFDMLKTAKYTDVESMFTQAKNLNIDALVTYEWLNGLSCKYGNVDFCLQDVEDKMIRRKTKNRLSQLDASLSDMSKPPQVEIDRAMGDVYTISTKKADDMIFDSKTAVSSTMALLHERMKNPGQLIGYDLGPNFRKISRALLGIQTKTLTIVSANQSVGKTQLCENWAMHMAVTDNVPTLWISLEMDKDRMTFRHLSMLSGVPLADLQTGNITTDDAIKRINPVAARLENAPFYISERGHDITEALAIAKRYVTTYHVKVIYVDYIQLQYVSSATNQQRHRELGIISKAWKQFSKEMDVAVVGISQLSKEALKEDVAKAEHGAGSYEIAQDADNYITLKEKSEEDIAQQGIENGNLVANIDKNRMGEADILINVYSDRTIQTMQEVGII